jgi:L-seryl-tRNA(Ser) seleniumtransferase
MLVQYPLTRAVRTDKMTLAALAATLRLYRDPEQARTRIPLLRLLATSADNLRNRAERIAPQIQPGAWIASATPLASTTYLGGGSVPTQQLPTWCVALEPAAGRVEEMARRLRVGQPPVVGRIQQDRLLLDLRTVYPHQDSQLLEAIADLQRSGTSG